VIYEREVRYSGEIMMDGKKEQSPQVKASKQWWIWSSVLATVLALVVVLAVQKTMAADIVVYKSPTCGCCGKWVEHMEQAGFSVDVEDMRDIAPVKRALGVPARMQSCHTAKVGDYLIEGHVPADLVRRMLDEKPDIKGLAVPGMPMGSPGMEGPRKDPYDVIAVGKDGGYRVYARR
jgi:hypothetical protein